MIIPPHLCLAKAFIKNTGAERLPRYDYWENGLLGVGLLAVLQQSADGQGDALVLGIHVGDLHLHVLTLGQHILGLADAAVSDLGNVNQAVHAGQDLSKCAELDDLNDLHRGDIADGVLKGNIYVDGGFDPRFNVDDMRAFVESLHKMGIDTIRGTLYADRSMKDDKMLGEGWCWDDDNPVISPLVFSRKDEFMVRFRRELQEAGIYVDAFTSTGRKPADAKCIITRFHTIDQILMKMLKESDNLYAESMFYQIAASTGERPATASDARRIINRLLQKVGLDPKRYQIADGSGLSLYNYVSPQLEVRMLTYAWKNQNIYLHLYPSLPIAGIDGTLRNRMRGSFTNGNVHAKTGTVTGISSLCGYCRAANGHELCFSIINQGLMNGRNGRRFQDRVCTILCQP